MARPLHRIKIAPKGMGLNDFVAMQEGYFAAEGLDVEFDWKTFRGTQSSWKGLDYLQRPQDRPYTEDKSEVIQGACVWGSICNASAGMGRFVADAYGVSPWAIFVRSDSRIHEPQDLKEVPISVGMRAGSHFNVPFRLEKFLPLEHIKTVNTGGFGARLRALLDGEVEAASLLPPQIAMAEQLGLRKIIEDTFHTLWWVPRALTPNVVLSACTRARRAGARGRSSKISAVVEARSAAGIRERASLGLRQLRPRRAFRLPGDTAFGIRRGARPGQALGTRSISQGHQLRTLGGGFERRCGGLIRAVREFDKPPSLLRGARRAAKQSSALNVEGSGLLRGACHRAGHFGSDPLARNEEARTDCVQLTRPVSSRALSRWP